jgi:hypothetical protein
MKKFFDPIIDRIIDFIKIQTVKAQCKYNSRIDVSKPLQFLLINHFLSSYNCFNRYYPA